MSWVPWLVKVFVIAGLRACNVRLVFKHLRPWNSTENPQYLHRSCSFRGLLLGLRTRVIDISNSHPELMARC